MDHDGCGGAGMPCPDCNVCNEDNPPRLPTGFQPDEDLVETMNDSRTQPRRR
jgi:hypothetical protein